MAITKTFSIKNKYIKLFDELSDIRYNKRISESEAIIDAIKEYIQRHGIVKPTDQRITTIPNIYSTSREIIQFYDSIKSILEYDGLSEEIDKWREIHAYNKGRFYKKETRSSYYDIMRQT